MLTVAILTKNEQENIAACIAQCDFADEILVCDQASTDDTVAIATRTGARVISVSPSLNFSQIRNEALEKATHPWVLYIDADERLSAPLKIEIEKVLKTKRADYTGAFAIKRRDFFWGHEMKYGELLKLRQKGILRLVKKGSGKWRGFVHEVFVTEKPKGLLASFLDHYPHPTIASFLQTINQYSDLRARELFDQKIAVTWMQIVLWPTGKFIYTYIIRLGFLDGSAGFIYSFMMSFHSFLVRSKLYVLKNK